MLSLTSDEAYQRGRDPSPSNWDGNGKLRNSSEPWESVSPTLPATAMADRRDRYSPERINPRSVPKSDILRCLSYKHWERPLHLVKVQPVSNVGR